MVSALAAISAVRDPEIWALTIADLGILRSVTEDPDSGRVRVTITPTYAGCPAMDAIAASIRAAARDAGYPQVEVATVLEPAWSTDMITAAGLAKLRGAGIAPPVTAPRLTAAQAATRVGADGRTVLPMAAVVVCPRCGAVETEQLSRFGSTACKALYRCRACGDPFDYLKPH